MEISDRPVMIDIAKTELFDEENRANPPLTRTREAVNQLLISAFQVMLIVLCPRPAVSTRSPPRP